MTIMQLPERKELADHFYNLFIEALPDSHRIEDYYFGLQHSAQVFADRVHNVQLFRDPLVHLIQSYEHVSAFVLGDTDKWGEPVRFAENTLFYLSLSNYPVDGPLGVWAAKVFTAQHRHNAWKTPGISGPAQLGDQLPEFVALARVARDRNNELQAIDYVSGFEVEALVIPPPPEYDIHAN